MKTFWTDTPLNGWESAGLAVWFAAAIVLVYVYAGYPFLLGTLSVLFRRSRKQPGYTPAVTVLIAAYNEEADIGRKVRQTLELRYPKDKFDILVCSDGSTDRTDEIVQEIAKTEPHVRLLRVEGRRGKTNAQNEGVKRCRGEVIVFSDATTVYHPDSLALLACHYEDPRVGAVSGRYKYFDLEGGSPTGLGSIAFWNYENLIKLFQGRIHTLTGCSGCIYSVRKSAYTPLPDAACSDLVEPLHVVRQGYRVAFEDRALAYEEVTATSKQEFKMRVRVVTRGIRGVLSVPELLNPVKRPWIAFQLLSHKLLRWTVPVLLILIFGASVALIRRPVFQIALTLQLAFYATALLTLRFPLHKRWKPLGIPLFFCTLNTAALVGLIEILRGNRYTVWETVRQN
jgi:cellulose synthase/poly-beta-1,6-N-acetylglucosamine synthase-like glycosyltransferase